MFFSLYNKFDIQGIKALFSIEYYIGKGFIC